MIYLLRKHDIISVPSYAEGIYHRTIVRYHIEDISPVPTGTDIIEKMSLLSVDKRDFFRGDPDGIRYAAVASTRPRRRKRLSIVFFRFRSLLFESLISDSL